MAGTTAQPSHEPPHERKQTGTSHTEKYQWRENGDRLWSQRFLGSFEGQCKNWLVDGCHWIPLANPNWLLSTQTIPEIFAQVFLLSSPQLKEWRIIEVTFWNVSIISKQIWKYTARTIHFTQTKSLDLFAKQSCLTWINHQTSNNSEKKAKSYLALCGSSLLSVPVNCVHP